MSHPTNYLVEVFGLTYDAERTKQERVSRFLRFQHRHFERRGNKERERRIMAAAKDIWAALLTAGVKRPRVRVTGYVVMAPKDYRNRIVLPVKRPPGRPRKVSV